MREILFRGKTEQGEWVEGYMWGNPTGMYILPKAHELAVWLDSKGVIPTTISQFTGLTDKNGTKIFEGDVLKNQMARYNKLIAFDGNGWKWKSVIKPNNVVKGMPTYEFEEILDTSDCEVIGNIHDKEVAE